LAALNALPHRKYVESTAKSLQMLPENISVIFQLDLTSNC
jgi:hypothetical protein